MEFKFNLPPDLKQAELIHNPETPVTLNFNTAHIIGAASIVKDSDIIHIQFDSNFEKDTAVFMEILPTVEIKELKGNRIVKFEIKEFSLCPKISVRN